MDIFGDHHQGVMHFRGGEVAYLMFDKEDGCVKIRYESGWYVPYRLDGTRIRAGYIVKRDGTTEEVVGGSQRDVVRFEPMTREKAKEEFPHILENLCP